MIGILLTNTGTPGSPSPRAVWHYLREFLSDKRIVQLPQWLWQPLLYAVILPSRSLYSANLYKKIWTKEGSPLRHGMESIVARLQEAYNDDITVVVGMHYGQPSIESALDYLRKKQVERIFVLPLYPQYSQTTTASTFDKVSDALRSWSVVPEIRMIREYASHPAYIQALAQQIKNSLKNHHEPSYLLLSFHGLPKRYADKGDPYPTYCKTTAELLAQELNLAPHEWSFSFQSRTGYAEWLKPYTQAVLESLPQRGIKHVTVVCPGFPVDCLETLEEVAIRCKERFMQAGGLFFHYIPALNDSPLQIQLLTTIINQQLQGW
ncbi:MAG: ferrochelatase [Gammaproteobacteria bacterium RIFCSPHIGHO2_12_FULL_42_13]|nr:MAG: ferrochelatase [Gammaproteobacteria bacterium RIFCSPHIGHO2_12_FULL_42_13]